MEYNRNGIERICDWIHLQRMWLTAYTFNISVAWEAWGKPSDQDGKPITLLQAIRKHLAIGFIIRLFSDDLTIWHQKEREAHYFKHVFHQRNPGAAIPTNDKYKTADKLIAIDNFYYERTGKKYLTKGKAYYPLVIGDCVNIPTDRGDLNCLTTEEASRFFEKEQ